MHSNKTKGAVVAALLAFGLSACDSTDPRVSFQVSSERPTTPVEPSVVLGVKERAPSVAVAPAGRRPGAAPERVATR